jgi:hypothetical protein
MPQSNLLNVLVALQRSLDETEQLGAEDYADWAKIHKIRGRAKKYFSKGEPFDQALSGHQNMFDEMNTIRNAIAHSSRYSQKKFKSLVRRRLGTYPAGLTIGKFLTMHVPRSTYPEHLSSII